jgi:hypothetical protein
MTKDQQQETRGHVVPAIISTDRTIAHREFMTYLEAAEECTSGFQEAFSMDTMDYADCSVDTMWDDQPVPLEQFTKILQHRRGTICKVPSKALSVPLSDPDMRDVLNLICHADLKLGTGDQTLSEKMELA